MKIELPPLFLLSVFLLCLPAVGQDEIVFNGGGEMGDLAGWIVSGDDYWTIADNGSASAITPHSGSYEIALGTGGSLGNLWQTVPTTPGSNYLLSFWLNHSGGDPNDVFSVSWNGISLLNQTNPPAPIWTMYQFVVTAIETNTILLFNFEASGFDYLGLDDVSLQSQNNILPTVTLQPTNMTVIADQPAIFSLAATGSAPISYQWQFEGTPIAGANCSSYKILSATPTNAGNYTCAVGNSAGAANSLTATLTVNADPTITQQPTNVVVYAGQSATFSAAATGPQPLYYQWLFGVDGAPIVGATNATLNLNNVQPTNGGLYAVKVSNNYASMVSSNALLTVLIVPPYIVTQPTNQTVYAGDAATLRVVAGGTAPLSYQWSFNATNLVGATNAALTITNAQPNQTGNYAVLVSNTGGSTNSATVTLTVNPSLPLLPFPLTANQQGTVTCLENPAYTYEIYLPPAYARRGTPLPIFYTMNATGGGLVSTFKATCQSLNIIVVGITGTKNGLPWDKVIREIHAVTRDVRQRVLYDATAEFAGGMSGGGECAYMLARMRAQHVTGLFEMAGSMGRFNSGATVRYYGIDRLQTNLFVARTTGTSDTASLFYAPFHSNFLATCGVVIKDWSFSGGHTLPPEELKAPILQWLISQRVPAGPNDFTNAFILSTNWQTRIAAGQHEAVFRECVSNLMTFPRSWFAYQAQLTLEQLLTNYSVIRSLNVSNLAQGDFASDLFYYYARGAATNADWSRYDSCMKALTGISVTNNYEGTITITGFPSPAPFTGQTGSVFITTYNGDRAGDIYSLLTNYNHYPSPLLQTSAGPDPGQLNLWLWKDTPGLAYSVQATPDLLSSPWQDLPVTAVDTNTFWSTTIQTLPGVGNGFYRIYAIPSPATSPPWPPQ